MSRTKRILEKKVNIQYLPPANEVYEGYVFTGVCLSKGVCLPLVWGCLQHTPPRQTPPAQCMLGYTPLPSTCWDMVNKRAVRIPLGCFLVCHIHKRNWFLLRTLVFLKLIWSKFLMHLETQHYSLTRMYSSRMSTTRFSACLSCVHTLPHMPCHAHPLPCISPTTHAPPVTHAPFCHAPSHPQTLLKILPCPKLRLRAVIMTIGEFVGIIFSRFQRYHAPSKTYLEFSALFNKMLSRKSLIQNLNADMDIYSPYLPHWHLPTTFTCSNLFNWIVSLQVNGFRVREVGGFYFAFRELERLHVVIPRSARRFGLITTLLQADFTQVKPLITHL